MTDDDAEMSAEEAAAIVLQSRKLNELCTIISLVILKYR